MTDDQRGDMLTFPDGTVAMPTVESELVGHGMMFSNAFVANSLCCPSRTSTLTGKYSHSTGVYENQGTHGGFHSFDDSSTIATWLHNAGYRTGLVGKYLNGYGVGDAATIPPGWDSWFGLFNDQGGYYNYSINADGLVQNYGSDPGDYSTDVFAAQADQFIRNTSNPEPLFLYFAPKAPHEVAIPAPRDKSDFADQPPYRPPNFNEADVSDKPAYIQNLPRLTADERRVIAESRLNEYRTLEAVDDAVRTIVTALQDTGRLSNTLIAFTSDNGLAWGEHRWNRKKSVPYEESIRVPMIVRYDPLLQAPATDDHLVLNIDLAPTFAEAAGVASPGAEGQSFLPLLTDPNASWRTDFLVEHLDFAQPYLPKFCAVRNEQYTYVGYRTGEEELYDLAADPYQLNNVAGVESYAETLSMLRSRMFELCDPPPPPIRLSTSQASFRIGTSVRIDGDLTFPSTGPVADAIVHVSRTDPDGSVDQLPDVVTDASGQFQIQDFPPALGAYRYSASWDGDAQWEPASDSDEVFVVDTIADADFNGDGFADLAVGVPGEDVQDVVDAGVVEVMSGSAQGLQTVGSQVWSQGANGLLGTPSTGDAFSSALAAGDFNGDGNADLAVGAPYDDDAGQTDSGAVAVLWGSSGGLSASANELWTMVSVPGMLAQPGDQFGRALAAGDFSGDGFADLAIGIPGRSVEGQPAAGMVVVLQGGPDLAVQEFAPTFAEGWVGTPGAPEEGDQFGLALAAGDFSGDGYDDLAAGAPTEDLGTKTDAGAAFVIYGTSHGLDASGGRLLTQGSHGVAGRSEPGDEFGLSIGAGDFNGDAASDFAVGAPLEDVGQVADAGAVNVLYGPGVAGNIVISQNKTGGVETSEPGDQFGGAVNAGDVNGDGFADLVVGASGEDLGSTVDTGGADVIHGSASGLSSTGNTFLTQDGLGGGDPSESGDLYGAALAVLDFNQDGYADLAAGVPAEDVGDALDAGALNIAYGSQGGLGSDNGQFLTQDALDGGDPAETGDGFGWALAPTPSAV